MTFRSLANSYGSMVECLLAKQKTRVRFPVAVYASRAIVVRHFTCNEEIMSSNLIGSNFIINYLEYLIIFILSFTN